MMRRCALLSLLLAGCLAGTAANAQKSKGRHSFAVIGHMAGDEAKL